MKVFMKVLRIIFYSVFLFFAVPAFTFAENGEPYAVNCTWIIKDTDTILCINLIPKEGYYTYAPLQENVYPTEIFLNAESVLREQRVFIWYFRGSMRGILKFLCLPAQKKTAGLSGCKRQWFLLLSLI